MQLLSHPELRCYTSAQSNWIELSDAGTFEHRIGIDRHHEGNCAPYWMASERRQDESGQWWRSTKRMVPSEFGVLVEVPQ